MQLVGVAACAARHVRREDLRAEPAALTPAVRALLAEQSAWARALMQSGAPLVHRLPGRIGWELRLMVQGGLRILEAIEKAEYDVFRRRPTLAAADWIVVAWRALKM